MPKDLEKTFEFLLLELFEEEDVDLNSKGNRLDTYDSNDLISLILAVEQRFNLEISSKEVDRLITLADLLELVSRKTGHSV